jgi:hypothetical protein
MMNSKTNLAWRQARFRGVECSQDPSQRDGPFIQPDNLHGEEFIACEIRIVLLFSANVKWSATSLNAGVKETNTAMRKFQEIWAVSWPT